MKLRIARYILAGVLTATPAFGEEAQPVTPYTGVDIASKYADRGLEYGPDPVLQLFAGAEHKGFGLTGFVNHNLHTDQVDEADLFASYTKDFGKATLFTETGYFTFPNTDLSDTMETQVKLTSNTRLHPYILAARDWKNYTGNYFETGIAGSDNLEWEVALGYNDEYYTDISDISHIEATLGKTFTRGNYAFTPSISWSEPLHDDIDRHVVVGLNVSH